MLVIVKLMERREHCPYHILINTPAVGFDRVPDRPFFVKLLLQLAPPWTAACSHGTVRRNGSTLCSTLAPGSTKHKQQFMRSQGWGCVQKK